MTARLGARIHGLTAGAASALLLVLSPSFLCQLLQPLSDVPATAAWTTCLVLLLSEGWLAMAGAGLAASLAILTRPNLVSLTAVVGALLIWRVTRADDGAARRCAFRNLGVFVATALPGCLAVAAFNQQLYGSPLASGYEELGSLYDWANGPANLVRYPLWLIETQTPFVCLALAAPWLMRKSPRPNGGGRADEIWLLLAWVAAVVVSYLFYTVFGPAEWPYLRFLLPAFPPLLVLTAAVALAALDLVIPRPSLRSATWMLLCALVMAWQWREAVERCLPDCGQRTTVCHDRTLRCRVDAA